MISRQDDKVLHANIGTSKIACDGRRIVDYSRSFEWWYFDFDLQAGRSMYLEWHAPVFNCRGNNCILVLRLRGFGNELQTDQGYEKRDSIARTYRYERSRVTMEEGCCRILFPGGVIKEEGTDYLIEVREKDLSLDLRLRRQLPPVPGDEILWSTGSQEQYLSWSVPLPRASVEGRMTLPGGSFEVKGESYHDHNWGNLHIGKHLKGWTWARLFFQDYVVVFGTIAGRSGKAEEDILYLLGKTGVILRTRTVKKERLVQPEEGGMFFQNPKEMSISFADERQYKVQLTLSDDKAVQEFPLGNFDSHRLNALYAAGYYGLKLHLLPAVLRTILGRGVYSQFSVKAVLRTDDGLQQTGKGKLETFSFGT